MSYKYSYSSWWWTWRGPKHVEVIKKLTKYAQDTRIVHQVGFISQDNIVICYLHLCPVSGQYLPTGMYLQWIHSLVPRTPYARESVRSWWGRATDSRNRKQGALTLGGLSCALMLSLHTSCDLERRQSLWGWGGVEREEEYGWNEIFFFTRGWFYVRLKLKL